MQRYQKVSLGKRLTIVLLPLLIIIILKNFLGSKNTLEEVYIFVDKWIIFKNSK